MKDGELLSYGSPVTREDQVTKRPNRERKKRWTRIYWKIPAKRPEEMVDRRGLQKKRPKMEKRKQRDERKVTGRRQKGGYKRKSKWQYLDSEPGIRGAHMAPRWKGLAIHYAPSATPIYPSTTSFIIVSYFSLQNKKKTTLSHYHHLWNDFLYLCSSSSILLCFRK
jgi:hypothetical protein